MATVLGTTDQTVTEKGVTLEQWLEAALPLAGPFPAGHLTLDPDLQRRAAVLLEGVRADLAAPGEAMREYFDTSRPRYEYSLSLVLRAIRGRVLDLGCSPGHLAMAMVKAGFDVHGVDLNPIWLAKYVPGWPDRLHVRHADIEKEPIPAGDASFDVVMFTEVLEHIAIRDPQAVLAEIRRVLRPGGRMVLSTPNVANASNILALLGGHNVFWPPEMFYGSVDRHNREYTPAELVQLIERVGFSAYELGYTNTWSNWHHVTGPWFARDWPPHIARHPLFNNTLFIVATR